MDELISVIIPIYNVEEYLNRCVESILKQTYKNLEIVLVDDGSTDASGKIADKYETIDNRVVVYHKENGGLSDARNYGLDRMKGKYVTFIDSDDYVSSKYVEVLYNSLINNNSDIAIVDTKLVFNNSCEEIEPDEIIKEETFERVDALIRTLRVELRQSAWGKLYKSEMFRNIRFPKGKLYEDLAIVFDLLLIASNITYVNASLYYYMVRDNSIMQEKFNIRQMDEVQVIEAAMQRILEEEELQFLEKLCRARRIYSYFVVLRRILYSEEKEHYLEQRKLLKKKIYDNSYGLCFDKTISMSVRLKIMSLVFGECGFVFLQKIVDFLHQRKYKKRFM